MHPPRDMTSEVPCPKVFSRTAKMQAKVDSYLKLVNQLARIIWWTLELGTNPFTVRILTKTDLAGASTTVMIVWTSKVSSLLKMAFSTRLLRRFTLDRARTSIHSTTLRAQANYHTKLQLPRSKVPTCSQTRGRRDSKNGGRKQSTWKRSSKNGASRTRRPSACSRPASESRKVERRRSSQASSDMIT